MNPLPTPTGRIDGAILIAPTPPATGSGLSHNSTPEVLLIPLGIFLVAGALGLVRHWWNEMKFRYLVRYRLNPHNHETWDE